MTMQRRCSSLRPPRQRRKSGPSDGSPPVETRSTKAATSASLSDSAGAGFAARRLKITLRASATIQAMASPLVRSYREDFSQIRTMTSCSASSAAAWSLINRLQMLNNFGPTARYRLRNATLSPSATFSSVVASSPFDTCCPDPRKPRSGYRGPADTDQSGKVSKTCRNRLHEKICGPAETNWRGGLYLAAWLAARQKRGHVWQEGHHAANDPRRP